MNELELKRFVDNADQDSSIGWLLRHSRTNDALILEGRKLICRVTRIDLQNATAEGQQEQRLRWMDGHREAINPADGWLWEETEQNERF